MFGAVTGCELKLCSRTHFVIKHKPEDKPQKYYRKTVNKVIK